jgi:diguanylate cyclase (GGDEF)-like protein
VDIDQLQAVNERGGQAAGDAVIQAVAGVIKRSVREVDVVARFGGDEFLVVLPSTHFAGSVAVAERIWTETHQDLAQSAPDTTVSIGVAFYPSKDVRSKDALLRAADAALFQAKREGGDRICVFQQQGFVYSPAASEDSKPPSSRR